MLLVCLSAERDFKVKTARYTSVDWMNQLRAVSPIIIRVLSLPLVNQNSIVQETNESLTISDCFMYW